MMKEILEYVDKLQTNLDEVNATKTTVEAWAKTIEDQVTDLQRRVQELQSRVEENRAATVVDVFRFHKLSVAQLHPNGWRIMVAFLLYLL